MKRQAHSSLLLRATACVLALMGLGLLGGGAWLAALGDSWFYAAAGVLMLLVALLLAQARSAALWVQALLVGATLAWSLHEAGLDWWAIAIRGDVPFLVGLLLLTPWFGRRLQSGASGGGFGNRRHDGWASGRIPLALALLAFGGVAVLSWLSDPHQKSGSLPYAPLAAAAPTGAAAVPAGEWHAYGRTGLGQRYAPLNQITPANVAQLEVAWHFRSGDVRGRAGDPVETTFEVTPLKIGERLFLCTPHQQVIALDARSGAELWRYDPQIRSGLALQHLTCRGLAYQAPRTAPAAAAPAAAAGSAPALAAPELPVAAAQGKAIDDCPAKLFMPTADGRVIALDPASGAVCRRFGTGTGQINLWAGMPNAKLGATTRPRRRSWPAGCSSSAARCSTTSPPKSRLA
jgi:quinoprotein glucose dehydrogenase